MGAPVISRMGEQRRAAWESQGASPPSLPSSLLPVSGRLQGASEPRADGTICKGSVHGEFAPISLSELKTILATIDGTPTVY